MDFIFRKFKNSDFDEIFSMMKTFYNSPADFTNGNDEIFKADIEACLDENFVFAEGYVFLSEEKFLGYAMLSKSFSTEFGKSCIWLEDLYLKPEYRGHGIIPKFISHISTENKNSMLRLEVEDENAHAVHVYEKLGFSRLPYVEMKKEI